MASRRGPLSHWLRVTTAVGNAMWRIRGAGIGRGHSSCLFTRRYGCMLHGSHVSQSGRCRRRQKR
eukprot:5276238-Prymnesium_polylepis.1